MWGGIEHRNGQTRRCRTVPERVGRLDVRMRGVPPVPDFELLRIVRRAVDAWMVKSCMGESCMGESCMGESCMGSHGWASHAWVSHAWVSHAWMSVNASMPEVPIWAQHCRTRTDENETSSNARRWVKNIYMALAEASRGK